MPVNISTIKYQRRARRERNCFCFDIWRGFGFTLLLFAFFRRCLFHFVVRSVFAFFPFLPFFLLYLFSFFTCFPSLPVLLLYLFSFLSYCFFFALCERFYVVQRICFVGAVRLRVAAGSVAVQGQLLLAAPTYHTLYSPTSHALLTLNAIPADESSAHASETSSQPASTKVLSKQTNKKKVPRRFLMEQKFAAPTLKRENKIK